MYRLLVFSACIYFGSSLANGQDEMLGRMNQMVTSLRVARVEAANASSELEIIESQSEQIANLTVEYKRLLQEYATYVENDNQPAALAIMATQMPKFESRLRSDILLPHQSELLTKMVFSDLLKSSSGSLLRSISTNYANVFNFNDAQKRKFREIEARAKKEAAEAERKFKTELAKIAISARLEVEKALSPSQLKALKRLSENSVR